MTDFTSLYQSQWWVMVRVAVGLVDQLSAAEDVVQDAFAGLYNRWSDLRNPAAAAAYLHRSVINGCRSTLRRRATARRHLASQYTGDAEPADNGFLRSLELQLVRQALSGLPQRQREVLTMSFVGEFSDAEIAQASGLSIGGVRSARSRGLAAMRETLEERS